MIVIGYSKILYSHTVMEVCQVLVFTLCHSRLKGWVFTSGREIMIHHSNREDITQQRQCGIISSFLPVVCGAMINRYTVQQGRWTFSKNLAPQHFRCADDKHSEDYLNTFPILHPLPHPATPFDKNFLGRCLQGRDSHLQRSSVSLDNRRIPLPFCNRASCNISNISSYGPRFPSKVLS